MTSVVFSADWHQIVGETRIWCRTTCSMNSRQIFLFFGVSFMCCSSANSTFLKRTLALMMMIRGSTGGESCGMVMFANERISSEDSVTVAGFVYQYFGSRWCASMPFDASVSDRCRCA